MNFQKTWNKTFTKACRENLKVKIMTDIYIYILEVANFFQKPFINRVQVGLSRYSIN